MGTEFVPGLELAGRFSADVVRPLLAELCPGLCYWAALLGPASEVLGFDGERSTDHSSRFTVALRGSITDPAIRALPLADAVNQVIDSTDALADATTLRAAVAALLHPASS